MCVKRKCWVECFPLQVIGEVINARVRNGIEQPHHQKDDDCKSPICP